MASCVHFVIIVTLCCFTVSGYSIYKNKEERFDINGFQLEPKSGSILSILLSKLNRNSIYDGERMKFRRSLRPCKQATTIDKKTGERREVLVKCSWSKDRFLTLFWSHLIHFLRRAFGPKIMSLIYAIGVVCILKFVCPNLTKTMTTFFYKLKFTINQKISPQLVGFRFLTWYCIEHNVEQF